MEEHVNHPNHYIAANGMETIDVIDAYTAKLHGVVAFDIGNALKYTCRFAEKNGTEDLEKAIWYLNHAIKRYEAQLRKAKRRKSSKKHKSNKAKEK